ncbi:MAG: FeoB-associated Cys-rich membrane protein [Desulfovibrio sp.]|nr:FeoB-associated Cys-rich membrane protein [Desulfovibrio sp.]
MNFDTILVICIVAAAFAFFGYRIYNNLKGGGCSCGCGCSCGKKSPSKENGCR